MENMFFLFSGLLLAFLGAIPLGTVNLAVINSSIQNKKKATKQISFAAGFAEVVIVLFAYLYGKTILTTIQNQFILQYAMIFVLLSLGVYFLLKKETSTSLNLNMSNFGKGFLLGLANPSVWVYWILTLSILEIQVLQQSIHNFSFFFLTLFFVAIYLGKVLALFIYGKFGKKLKNTKSKFKNTLIGCLLIFTAIIQLTSILS